MKKIAVVLSGSGVFDGAEIHEATLSLLAIMKNGGEYEIFAPNIEQHHVINHITGEEMNEKRNVLVESARIARGQIKDLKEYDAKTFDGILFPGGFGAAKNLSDFAFKGPDSVLNTAVERAIKNTHLLGKPIGALCIAPAIIARAIGDAEVTIGSDVGTAEAIEAMGATHYETSHGEVYFDKNNNIYSTPCYMLDANIMQIEAGANAVVAAMLK